MKIYKALLATLLFLALLFCIYWAHITFFNVNVVLYSAMADGMLAAALAAIFLFWRRKSAVFSRLEKLQLCLIWFLLGYILAISVPTVIDRSLSFYILEKVQQRGGSIPVDAFEDVFRNEYVKEHRLVDVRLTEQLESGTIVIRDGNVQLTDRGARLARFSRYFRTHLLPKQRLLMGKYTDDLTDPFRGSQGGLEHERK